MSWSSGSSSAPGYRAATGRRGEEGRSPVVYRENLMAYEPTRLCRCNPRRKAPRWISWSFQNPCRRYYACVNALNGRGCGYLEWHDSALPTYLIELIGDLRDEVWRLRGAQGVPAAPVEEDGRDAVVAILEEQLKEKDAVVAVLEEQLKEKDA